ncbi:HAD family hydrolase [Rugamonas sp.]|uniref:HAD family hydrolase n=1 Tax=Rugamonas sp. TaxID=1926287 RepID=UPI0025EA4DC3|nr:HAD family hydrolase [Rugamonas sp.]
MLDTTNGGGAADNIVFLIDCDNTLLDNDHIQDDLRARLEQEFGAAGRAQYWDILETLRGELGYVDYLGALQRFRVQAGSDTRLLRMSSFLLDYPFAERLYPGALEALARLATAGQVVMLSDGDVVFQPHKIERAGLWQALAGQVLIYVHKEDMLADIEWRYPAAHYVLIDDKPRLLDAMKRQWGTRLTTVFPRQGHYALDPAAATDYITPDVTIERIGDLNHLDLATLRDAARAAPN